MEKLRDLEGKIAGAIDKVKALKGEKAVLDEKNRKLLEKIHELEGVLMVKDEEIRDLSTERAAIKGQLMELLNELETVDLT